MKISLYFYDFIKKSLIFYTYCVARVNTSHKDLFGVLCIDEYSELLFSRTFGLFKGSVRFYHSA